MVGFKDYKYGLKKYLYTSFLKFSSELEREVSDILRMSRLKSYPEVITIRPNTGDSIYSGNIKGSKVHKRLIE